MKKQIERLLEILDKGITCENVCARNYKCFGVSETSRQGAVGDETGEGG